MDLKEFKEFLEANKKNQDVLDAIKSIVDMRVDDYEVRMYLETERGKMLIQPLLDSHFAKSLATWKEKTLPKELEKMRENVMAELNPVSDPTMQKIAELERKIAEKDRSESIYKQLVSAKDQLRSKAFAGVLKSLVKADESETIKNLNALNDCIVAFEKEMSAEKVKDAARPSLTGNVSQYSSKNNPFDRSSDSFSLTEQGRLLREDPEEYARLKALVSK